MEELPLVSVVVTTYKRKPSIVKRALDSVFMQEYINLQVILVNDYPEGKELSEHLRVLAESYQEKVVYLEMEHNGGACAARNLGLKYASGEYVAFLDDDDQWFPNKISLQMKSFDNPSVGIVYCNALAVFEESGKERNFYNRSMPEGYIFPYLFAKNIIGGASFPLLRKTALVEVGGFNVNMPALQDLELWLRISQKYEARYVETPLVKYYYYLGEKISAYPEKRIQGFDILHEQYKDYLGCHSDIYADFYLLGMSFHIHKRDFKTAGLYLKKAILLNPKALRKNMYSICRLIVRFFIKPKYL